MDLSPEPPDLTDLAGILAEEHRVIFGLLEALATDRRDRFPLAHRLIDELAAHTAVEQQLLYPALRDIVPGGVAMADRGQADHGAMRVALVALERSHPGQPEFEDALTTLTTEMRAHVPVEENEILPALRDVIGTDKMEELAVIYVQLKDSTPSGLQGLAPDIPEPEFRTW
jgi:iron-sulfur cluster repair protein YtfE (RIC family)